MKYCKNCDRTFEEAFTFCPMCTSRLLSELEVQKLNEEIDAKLKAEEKRKKKEKEEAIVREKAIKELEETYYKVLPFYEILKKVNADHLTKFYNLFGRDGLNFPLYQIINDWYQQFSKNDFDESGHLKRLVHVYPLKLAGPSAIRVETLEIIIADVLKLVDPTTSISDIKQILLEKAKPLSTPFDETTILKKWKELVHALNPHNPNINSEFYGEYFRTVADLSFLNAYIRGGTVQIISSIEQKRTGSWMQEVPYERTYTNTYTSTTLKYNCSLQTLIAKKVNAHLRTEKDHLEIVKLYLEMDFAILLHRKITIINKNATTPFGLHDYLCGKLIEINGFATYGNYKYGSSGHRTACISSRALFFSADKIDSKTDQAYSSF